MPRSLPSLPLHLTLQGMLSVASNNALQQLKLVSQNSNANWQQFAGMWPFQPDAEALEKAVQHELRKQNANLLEGIHRYLRDPYERPEPQAETLWQGGGSRLLDYGLEKGAKQQGAMFFIPSLINRHYILDLMEGRSLIAHLRAAGIRSYVLDWGDPGEGEAGFTLTDYVLQKLEPALASIRKQNRKPLFLAGYCMGGLLALALAQRQEKHFSGLALLAMPWDFHAAGFPRVPLSPESRGKLRKVLAREKTLSGEAIQAMFYASNPWIFSRKFASFGQLDAEEGAEFIAIESWVNDNVAMPSAVAEECLIGWVQENLPARGGWKVDGAPIVPDALSLPVFAACPTQDTIVPPGSAEAILPALHDGTTVCRPLSGHVGMVAGPRAHKELWRPLTLWIESHISA